MQLNDIFIFSCKSGKKVTWVTELLLTKRPVIAKFSLNEMGMIHYEIYDSLPSHFINETVKLISYSCHREKSTKIVKFMAQESRQLIMKCFLIFHRICNLSVFCNYFYLIVFVQWHKNYGVVDRIEKVTLSVKHFMKIKKKVCPPQIFLYVKKKLGGMGHLHVVTYYVLK